MILYNNHGIMFVLVLNKLIYPILVKFLNLIKNDYLKMKNKFFIIIYLYNNKMENFLDKCYVQELIKFDPTKETSSFGEIIIVAIASVMLNNMIYNVIFNAS